MRKTKLAVISVHPAPYRDPVLVELARNDSVELTVFVLFPIDSGHPEWKFKREEYPAEYGRSSLRIGRDFLHLNIIRRVITGGFDIVVVPGISRITCRTIVAVMIALGRKYILALDTTKEGPRSAKSNLISRLNQFVRDRAIGLWVPGRASSEYLQKASCKHLNIVSGYYCFDSASLTAALPSRESARSMVLAEFNLQAKSIIFLAVGKFLPFRRYKVLVSAFVAAKEAGDLNTDSRLIILGDGPEYEELMLSAGAKCRDGGVILAGTRDFASLSIYLRSADIFVHPGEEPYSTATEYAALAGLPIIATKGVGYVWDLEELGGIVKLVDLDDEVQLENALICAVHDETHRRTMGAENMKAAQRRSAVWAANEILSLCTL